MNFALNMIMSFALTKLLKSSIETVNRNLNNVTIDELIAHYSPLVDDYILKYQEQGYISHGGTFSIRAESEKIKIEIQLYFKDEKQEWSKMALDNTLNQSIFNVDTVKSLKSVNEIKHPIDIPVRKVA